MSEINEGIQLEELNCSVCQEMYGNDDKNPRILNCGHTFCTTCLTSLLRSRSHCPECRIPINYKDVKAIPVAYIVKKIVESIDVLNKISLRSSTPPSDLSDSLSTDNLDVVLDGRQNPFPAVGMCTTHTAPQHFWCDTCSKWICGTCAYLEHSNRETDTFCLVLTASEHFDQLKRDEVKRLRNQTRELSHASATVKNFSELILSQIKNLPRSKLPDKEVFEISLMLRNKHDAFAEASDILNNSHSIVDVETMRQLKNSSQYIDNFFSCENFPQTEEELIEGVWSEIFSKLPSVLTNATYLFTSVRHDGLRHFSQMRVCGNYLVIPCFFPRPADANFLIPFSEVKRNAKSLKAFLRLNHKGRHFGSIQISLLNNKRADQFAMLCTGEKGPSYKKTCFFSSKGLFTRYISGGDYESNNGDGGHAIIDPPFDVPDVKMQDGLVCGEQSCTLNTLAQFKIFYEVGSVPYARFPIGVVEHGLDLVREIARQDYKQIFIEECGLLIPLAQDDGSFCHL